MLSKDILKTPTIEWAIVHPHSYVGRGNKNIDGVARSNAIRGKLVDTNRYHRTSRWNDTADCAWFVKAPDSEKKVGYLVEDLDNGRFYILPASEFLTSWSIADVQWTINEQKKEEVRQARETQQQKRDAVIVIANESARSTKESVVRSLASLLKVSEEVAENQVNCYGDTEVVLDRTTGEANYRPVISGNVQLPIGEFQRLLERVYESLDA